MLCDRTGCDEDAAMIVNTGRVDVALCGGHFFDCSDMMQQSGKTVRITPEGERIRAAIRQEETKRILAVEYAQSSAIVPRVHVHLCSSDQGRIRDEVETEEVRYDG